MKTCSKCQKSLPLSEFHKDKKNRDGHCSKCKSCKNAQKRSLRPPKKSVGVLSVSTVKTRTEPINAHSVETCEIAKVKILVEEVSVLSELSQKLGCHYSLSIQRDGKSRLQVHRHERTETYKALSPELLLEKVLVQ